MLLLQLWPITRSSRDLTLLQRPPIVSSRLALATIAAGTYQGSTNYEPYRGVTHNLRGTMPRCNQQLAIIFAVYALALTTLSAQQRTPDLDVPSLNRPTEEDLPDGLPQTGTREVIGGASIEGVVVQSPLQVRLLRLDPDSCSLLPSEPFTYDVELRNVGKTDLLLPWSVDPRDEGTADAGFFPVLSLSLGFQEGRARGLFYGSELLYGDTFKTFTIRRLRPREAVVVRAGAECRTTGETGTRDPFGPGSRPLRVIAQVTLKYRRNTGGPTAESSNAVPLTITWPETPRR